MTNTIKTVGVIGAGRMGQPIIGHIARKGFTRHRLRHRRRKARRRGGAGRAMGGERSRRSPADSDAVLICVGYDRQLRELVSAETAAEASLGAMRSSRSSRRCIPVRSRSSRTSARPFGVHLVDATMCRGGRAADEGTLLSFVGGDAAIVERLRPVLSCFATDIVATGAIGTAQVAKAANNMVMWAVLIANHEALALAKRSGVDVELLRSALLKTGAENYVLRHWGTNTMAWAEDDLEIVQSMAHNAGLGLPQAGLNRELCRTLKPKRFRLDEYGV